MPDSVAVPGARYAVEPAGIVSTAWPRVERTCRNIGWRFDPWQQAVGRLILAKNALGGWAADLSVMSIPRQVGKSYLLGCIIFALCLLQPRLRVIWTSHHTATTEEMYEAMKELAAHKRVAPHVLSCTALQGSRWRIKFRNGSRIDFGARERGFGRGKARVGVLVLDEFQHISMRALSNLTPTTNTADNPLILCAGTPPSEHDNAEAFTMRRKAALEGVSTDTLYVEFSADADAELDDRKQWAKANPSFPKRTPERAFLLNRKVLDDENFKREFLGIWDEQAAGEVGIPLEPWKQRGIVDVPPEWPLAAIGMDMHPTTGRLYVGVAAFAPEPGVHVELVAEDILAGGIDGAVAWILERARRRLPVVMPADSPATMLHAALKKARIQVYVLNLTEQWQASAALERAVATDGTLTHFADPLMDQAVKESTREQHRAPGQWRLGREGELAGAPMWAVTAAHFGAVKWSKRRGAASSKESARSGRTSGGRTSATREAVGV